MKPHSAFLQSLCNLVGDLKICRLEAKPDGTRWSSSWDTILSKWHLLEYYNNRQIGPHEVVIDIDREPRDENFKEALEQLNNRGVTYAAFFTGSKGYHIHCFSELTFSRLVASQYGDIQKLSKNTLIACEYAPHWKTGKPKVLIDSRFCGGFSWEFFQEWYTNSPRGTDGFQVPLTFHEEQGRRVVTDEAKEEFR